MELTRNKVGNRNERLNNTATLGTLFGYSRSDIHLFMRGITVAPNEVANLPIESHRAKSSPELVSLSSRTTKIRTSAARQSTTTRRRARCIQPAMFPATARRPSTGIAWIGKWIQKWRCSPSEPFSSAHRKRQGLVSPGRIPPDLRKE